MAILAKIYSFEEKRNEKNDRRKEIRAVRPKKKHTGGATLGGSNALKTREEINSLKNYFLSNDKRYGIRNYALVVFGLNCGKRAGDILRTKVKDVINSDKTLKDYFYIKEQKTGKPGKVYINDNMKNAIELYLNSDKDRQNYSLDEPLFLSRQKDKYGNSKAIEIRQFNNLLKEAQSVLNLKGKISTHTLRKTMARAMIDKNPDALTMVQKMLNHDSQADTLTYIDYTDDELERLHKEVQL